MDALLPDFSEAYSDFISSDGSLRPRVFIAAPHQMTWCLDIDGLLLTMPVAGIDGTPCLLSVLFRMNYGAAQVQHKRGRFPATHKCCLEVIRKIDEVRGDSGEVYSRFEANVQEM
jgi:hypothetical protein